LSLQAAAQEKEQALAAAAAVALVVVHQQWWALEAGEPQAPLRPPLVMVRRLCGL